MKKAIISGFDRLIVRLLGYFSLVGIMASCTKYGYPSADYLLQGTVTDNSSGEPIMHLQVVNFRNDGNSANDTAYTDSRGQFRFEYTDDSGSLEYDIKIEDIDGPANKGEFAEQTLSGTYKELRGIKYEKTLDIKMQRADTFYPMYGTFPAEYK